MDCLIVNNLKNVLIMKAKEKVVYVPPVYEEVQHEVTSVDENNVPLRTSFHTDVSLLQRIDNMRVDAQTLREIKESMQPMIDNSNFRNEFEETFGSLTDDELINSCPSRYTQTASEKMNYLKELAVKDREARDKAAAAAKEQEEKDKIENENKEFQARLLEIFK
jgi:predicted RND superfamily exporter protein